MRKSDQLYDLVVCVLKDFGSRHACATGQLDNTVLTRRASKDGKAGFAVSINPPNENAMLIKES